MNQRAVRVAFVPIVVGVLVCVGWQFRIGLLRGDAFSTFVAPNTALLFTLLGISCLLQFSRARYLIITGRLIAILCGVVSAAFLAEFLFNLNFRIDDVFLRHRLSDWTVVTPPGRPAFPTCVALVFASIGMATVRWPRWGSVSDTCATAVSAVSYLALVGYLYGVRTLFGGVMALHTAILLGVIAYIIYTARATPGIAELSVSEEAGGVIFRRVIVAIVVLTPLLGLLRLRAQQAGFLSTESGIALMVVTTVFLFTALTAGTAFALNDFDRKRKQTGALLMRTEKLAAAGRLSATIAHEINNPLEAVTNLLYLARTSDSAAQSREYIGIAEYELHRVAEISRRTLGFYREEARPTSTSLAELAEEVLRIFEQRMQAANVQLSKRFESRVTIKVRAGEIRQIMMNLIGNALDAVADSKTPELIVTIREKSRWVEFLVSDNGSGILPENRRHLFEPFFTTKEKVGTGLGLYVSRQLAISNSGSLDLLPADNSHASGCTFRLRLKAVHSAVAEATTTSTQSD